MKQLDIEYKNQISMEIPDLWSRIEAGVDAYEAEKIKNTSSTEDVSEYKESNIVKFSKKATRFATVGGGMIAAAACIFIVVKVVIGLKGAGDYSDAPSMNFATASDTCESAACEDAEAYYSDEAYEEAATEAEYYEKAATEAECYEETTAEAEICDTEEDNGAAVVSENVVTKINGTDISDAEFAVSLMYQLPMENDLAANTKFDMSEAATAGSISEKNDDTLDYVITRKAIIEEGALVSEAIGCTTEEAENMVEILKSCHDSEIEDIVVEDLLANYPTIHGEIDLDSLGTYLVTMSDGTMYQIYTDTSDGQKVLMILGLS